MTTMKNKLESELNATAENLGECTRDDINKLANGLGHTLTKATKMSLKHRDSKKKRENEPNKYWFNKDCYTKRKELKSLLNAKNRQPYNRKPNKYWFNKDCYTERKELKSLLNAKNRQPYNRDLQAKYFVWRKAYSHTVKQRKKAYKQELISNLHHALNKDPQTVWKMLRELKDAENIPAENKCQVSATKWLNHLKI